MAWTHGPFTRVNCRVSSVSDTSSVAHTVCRRFASIISTIAAPVTGRRVVQASQMHRGVTA
jgi:hypothetical protein